MTVTAIAIRPELIERDGSILSWRQVLVLKAAAQADCIPFRMFVDEQPGMIPGGVFRSLVMRGLLRQHPLGFEITDLGRFEVKEMERRHERHGHLDVPNRPKDRKADPSSQADHRL